MRQWEKICTRTVQDELVSRRLRFRVHREKQTAHSSLFFGKIVEIESSPLRRTAIFVSNVPKGRTLGFIAGGKRGQKKNALQATILRITRGLWTVNSKSKPWLYFMKCSIPRVITNKQKICSLRVKKTRFRNFVCRFCFMLCSLPRVSTSKQQMCSPRAKKNAFSQLCLLTLVFV